jgi:methionyl-tRNA formyltransferase
MKISVLCSSPQHPVYGHIIKWGRYDELKTQVADLEGGDVLFLISCSEIVDAAAREKYKHVLVIHAADLPQGRGWSPQIWQILEGKNEIVVTLLEAQDKVDSGDIWAQEKVNFSGDELHDEINQKIFEAEFKLMDMVIDSFDKIKPRTQQGEITYYKKRTPEDSQLDVNKTIAEQFNLLRVADPERYPAYFEINGQKYKIRIEKI